ncbi:MAG: hypothetical protein LBB24_00955, partial [Rickettsiales bacterium]|nr:hypothetical protein [Rickettsiales bacterium]
MRIGELLEKKVLIWGYGLEGRSALEFLLGHGAKEEIIVATNAGTDEKIKGARFIEERQILEQNFDVLIKSPGVSFYREEIAALLNRGVTVTSILNILLAETAGRGYPKTIGITGTKGKSTTALVCYSMLKSLGARTLMLGNMGISLLEPLDSLDSYDYLVLELSSCQLTNILHRMDYGILLNLFPEHIDWHISHENYFRDKLKILEYSEKCFLNHADPITLKYVNEGKHKYFFNDMDSFHLEGNFLCYARSKLAYTRSFGNIRGSHVFTNICAPLAVIREEGLDVARALESLRDFKTLPHRLEVFYDDRKT